MTDDERRCGGLAWVWVTATPPGYKDIDGRVAVEALPACKEAGRAVVSNKDMPEVNEGRAAMRTRCEWLSRIVKATMRIVAVASRAGGGSRGIADWRADE